MDLKRQLEAWEQQICGVAADELRAKRDQTSADNFESLLQFLSDSAEEISGLEKATLEEVVNSHRRNTSSRWKSAYEFLVRSASNLTVEQRQLLADWELVLCKVDKDTVVLLPGIRRSFGRVAQCVEEQQDALRNLKAKTWRMKGCTYYLMRSLCLNIPEECGCPQVNVDESGKSPADLSQHITFSDPHGKLGCFNVSLRQLERDPPVRFSSLPVRKKRSHKPV